MEDMAEYMRIRYKKFRAKALDLLGGKCAECGTSEDLEIDHVDPETKSFEPYKLYGMSWKRALTELKKCQLLCDRHHNEKTVRERGQKSARIVHGTVSSYRYCKCNLCREAKRESNRQQYVKRSAAS